MKNQGLPERSYNVITFCENPGCTSIELVRNPVPMPRRVSASQIFWDEDWLHVECGIWVHASDLAYVAEGAKCDLQRLATVYSARSMSGWGTIACRENFRTIETEK